MLAEAISGVVVESSSHEEEHYRPLFSGVATSLLEELDLGRNEITNDLECFTRGIQLLLSNATHLKHLDLEGNRIERQAGMVLSDALCHAHSLESLNLYNNSLGDSATIYMAPKLQDCHSLIRLDLGLNYISSHGGSALADFLSKNPPLQRLLLLGNGIGDGGAIQFSKALGSNQTLTELNLGFNKLSSVGLKALQEALYNTSSLNALVDSNHTLSCLFDDYCATNLIRWGCDEQTVNCIDNLLRINALNEVLTHQHRFSYSSSIPAKKKKRGPGCCVKIPSVPKLKVAIHLREQFDMRHFLDVDGKTMPEVLEFVSSNVGVDKLFHLLRDWNMPHLYSPQMNSAACG